jgi:hypothetical protein
MRYLSVITSRISVIILLRGVIRRGDESFHSPLPPPPLLPWLPRSAFSLARGSCLFVQCTEVRLTCAFLLFRSYNTMHLSHATVITRQVTPRPLDARLIGHHQNPCRSLGQARFAYGTQWRPMRASSEHRKGRCPSGLWGPTWASRSCRG